MTQQTQIVRQDVDLRENVELGDSTSDRISINGEVDTDIVPFAGTEALGSSANHWAASHVNTATVYTALVTGATTTAAIPTTNHGPGPLTNEVLYSFPLATYRGAVIEAFLADSANTDYYAATFTILHDGTSAYISSATGVIADAWGGTDPSFSAAVNGAGVEFRCTTADAIGYNFSGSVKLISTTFEPAITFLAQPVSTARTEGDADAVFTVSASTNDGGNLSYQWEVDTGLGFGNVSNGPDGNGNTYSGATSATLTIATTSTSADTYQYRCVVSSDAYAPSATSSAAVLTVNTASVTITENPPNRSVEGAGATTFTVIATKNETLADFTYQWQEDSGSGFGNLSDGGVYSSTNGQTLQISNVTGLSGNQYRVIVSTNSVIAPSATSAAGTLTVV